MNDQFLKDHYQSPRPAFVQSLAQRLHATRLPATQQARLRLPRAMAYAALTLLLTLGLALAISPTARAQILALYRQVGGGLFNETDRYPGGDEPAEIVPSQVLALDEARQVFPAAFGLPAWTPDGYQMSPDLSLTDFSDYGFLQLSITYRQVEPFDTAFTLHIYHSVNGEERKQIVGPDSVEEVTVSGRPAALVRGIWNAQAQRWDNPEHLALSWQQGGLTYELSSALLPVEDLVRIAESVE